jgi:hypothetical protein
MPMAIDENTAYSSIDLEWFLGKETSDRIFVSHESFYGSKIKVLDNRGNKVLMGKTIIESISRLGVSR